MFTCGGSSQLAGLRESLSEYFGKKFEFVTDPMEAVAKEQPLAIVS